MSHYRLFRLFDRESIDTKKLPVEMQILAAAYVEAWRSVHFRDPVGEHFLKSFGVGIDFGALDVKERAA
jgi:hypothetical protein